MSPKIVLFLALKLKNLKSTIVKLLPTPNLSAVCFVMFIITGVENFVSWLKMTKLFSTVRNMKTQSTARLVKNTTFFLKTKNNVFKKKIEIVSNLRNKMKDSVLFVNLVMN